MLQVMEQEGVDTWVIQKVCKRCLADGKKPEVEDLKL
jgi:hypothetical protein